MNNCINIVVICDKQYLLPTKTLINSIICNKLESDELYISVVGYKIDLKEQDDFVQFSSKSIKVRLLTCSDESINIDIVHGHVSKAALCKMLLPDLLPDIDKVIYLDSDMLVMDSLSELFFIDLEDKYAAVVRDFIGEKYQSRNIVLNTKYYFNSGMMLLNLKKMRENGIANSLVSARRQDASATYMDQDTFNIIMDNHIMVISPCYNYMLSMNPYSVHEIAEFYGVSNADMMYIQSHPVIIHYTDRLKPWNHIRVMNWKVWYEYVNKEDILSILEEVSRKTESDIKELKKRIEVLKHQNQSNVDFYEQKSTINVNRLNETEKEVYAHKDQIICALKEHISDRSIVIYGAGRIGQLLYKILCIGGFEKQIAGFAVSDERYNVSLLYGKTVQSINKYNLDSACIIYAIRTEESKCFLELDQGIEAINLFGLIDRER